MFKALDSYDKIHIKRPNGYLNSVQMSKGLWIHKKILLTRTGWGEEM